MKSRFAALLPVMAKARTQTPAASINNAAATRKGLTLGACSTGMVIGASETQLIPSPQFVFQPRQPGPTARSIKCAHSPVGYPVAVVPVASDPRWLSQVALLGAHLPLGVGKT